MAIKSTDTVMHFDDSEALLYAVYAEEIRELYVIFRKTPSKGYVYVNVPIDLVKGMFTAKSAGKYFLKNIHNNPKYKKE